MLYSRQIRDNVMGHPWVPKWGDIKVVLELHELWSADVQRKLDLCFTELLIIEAEQRKIDGPRTS